MLAGYEARTPLLFAVSDSFLTLTQPDTFLRLVQHSLLGVEFKNYFCWLEHLSCHLYTIHTLEKTWKVGLKI